MHTHTPTPWKIEEYKIENRFVVGDNGSEIAYAPVIEDAAFIVRAVNAHDDLVAALKEAEHYLDVIKPEMSERLRGIISAALAKTEGK